MSVEGGVASTVAGGVAASCLAGAAAYSLLAPFIKCTVNCHFCNQNSKVRRSEMNCWVCPHCDQYNGFTEDGDYNRPLQQLFHSPPPPDRVAKPKRVADNGLCNKCNLNQELKVSQLSSFEGEGRDLEEYKNHLERVYRLCGSCDEFLANKLSGQDSILAPGVIENKLERSRMRQSSSVSRPPVILRILRDAQILLAVVLFCALSEPSLDMSRVGGIFPVNLVTSVEQLADRLWLYNEFIRGFLASLLALVSLLMVRVKPVSVGALVVLVSMAASLPPAAQLTCSGLFATLVLLTPIGRHPRQYEPSPRRRIVDTFSSRFIVADKEQGDRTGTASECSDASRSSRNNSFTGILNRSASNMLISNCSLTPPTSSPANLLTTTAPEVKIANSFIQPSEASPAAAAVGGRRLFGSAAAFSPPPPTLLRMSSPILGTGTASLSHEFSIDASGDCDLASLTLGEEEPGRPKSSRPESHFSPRLYSPENTSGIRFNPARPVLRASKLASWVAGGYWTPPVPQTQGEPISRSSSQSSGFVSASVPSIQSLSVNQPPHHPYATLSASPVNSVFGEADRFSVVSDSGIKAGLFGTRMDHARFTKARSSATGDGSESSLERASQLGGDGGGAVELTRLRSRPSPSHPQEQATNLKTGPKSSSSGYSFTVTVTPIGVVLAASLMINFAVVWYSLKM